MQKTTIYDPGNTGDNYTAGESGSEQAKKFSIEKNDRGFLFTLA